MQEKHTLQVGDKVAKNETTTTGVRYSMYEVVRVTKTTAIIEPICNKQGYSLLAKSYVIYRDGFYSRVYKSTVFYSRPNIDTVSFLLYCDEIKDRVDNSIKIDVVDKWWKTKSFTNEEKEQIFKLFNNSLLCVNSI